MTAKHRTIATAALVTCFTVGVTACGDTGETGEDAAVTGDAQVETIGEENGGAATTSALVDPNSASESELAGLPGMDSASVAMIVAERPFENMLPLDSLLSERMDSVARDSLYRTMFIPLDLDSASREEILLIPGVGERMAHEFEEYRPYEGGMAEFRQEIGKYVDDDEVARLEQYVTVQ